MPTLKGIISWVGETRTTTSKKDASQMLQITTIEVESQCYREDGSTYTQHELFDCFGFDRQQLAAAAEQRIAYAFNISRDTREHEGRRYASNRCYAINATCDAYQS